MENRFKLRISRMFRVSFGSCRSRNVSDVIEKPVFVAENRRDFHLIEPLSPKVRVFPSICRTRLPETMEFLRNDCIVRNEVLHRRKVSERNLFFVSRDSEGRTCPPASPISPFNEFRKFKTEERKKKSKNKNTHKNRFSSSSAETNGGWFSSEDEIENETELFFTSRSFSSDSSDSHRRNKKSSRRKISGTRRRRAVSRNSEMGSCPLVTKGKVQESIAVVKRSRNPYNDFRDSMVEMIIEKQIFEAKDLEQLLQCFLSLNSSYHHKVIVEVFSEIWATLCSLN